MNVVITLCTRQRPEMLRTCLESVIVQAVPQGSRISIVIVENHDERNCEALVEEIAMTPNAPPIIYGHEPELGIPFARNRSLDMALARGPDWIGFIDDDEIAEPNWIATLAGATSTLPADVLQGPVVPVYAKEPPRWLAPKPKHRSTGTLRATAYTNNTLMRASLVRSDGLGLRFDETMRFTGGSDSDFFTRAVARGVVIRWVDEAVVKEMVPEERLSLRWNLERARRSGANKVYIDTQKHGRGAAIATACLGATGKATTAILELPLGALLLLIDSNLGRRTVYKALRKLWWVAGTMGSTFGVVPLPYKTVQGA
jgi:succinoglycan biosynthesis protein ExoM